jgi:hypothetical protein
MSPATKSANSNIDLTVDSLALIGLNINSKSTGVSFYLLVSYGGERDCPIMKDGRILLFKNQKVARKWVRRSLGTSIDWKDVTHNDGNFICNISGTLRLIERYSIDRSATIINCLNTFSDVLPVTGFKLPAQYRRVLVQFADHLTFHREYGKFLRQKNISRTVLRDAILWCLGSVIATSKFLEE